MFNITTTPVVAIMGDTHSDSRATIQSLKFARFYGVQTVFHVGDFGGWNDRDGLKYLKAVNKQLKMYGMTMYVTYGNHDDYSMMSDIGSADTKQIADHIHILNRPSAFTINNDTLVISLGGAASIDCDGLKENINWWKEEAITLGDLYKLRAMGARLSRTNWMITHDVPHGIPAVEEELRKRHALLGDLPPHIEAYADESREMVTQAVGIVRPRVLFGGHYHHRYTGYLPETKTTVEGLGMNGQRGNIIVVKEHTGEVIAEN